MLSWTYNGYMGCKFHHDPSVSGKHFTKGQAWGEGDKIQCLVQTGRLTETNRIRGAAVVFFLNGQVQGGIRMNLDRPEPGPVSLRAVVDFGVDARVQMNLVAPSVLMEMRALAATCTMDDEDPTEP